MASDPKSLAAEIEAVTERERTRLVAWLAYHSTPTGSHIDREMTADALMADFITPRLAEIDRLKDRLEIKWAYDGSGNRVPFPEGMEDCDGIACRDETIRGLEERLAALQSRAFEDGARKRLTDALTAYDAAESKRATSSAVYDEISNRMGGYPDIGEIMDRVGAEEACMRASLAADLARSKLIAAFRAALQPTPTTEDKGREDRA